MRDWDAGRDNEPGGAAHIASATSRERSRVPSRSASNRVLREASSQRAGSVGVLVQIGESWPARLLRCARIACATWDWTPAEQGGASATVLVPKVPTRPCPTTPCSPPRSPRWTSATPSCGSRCPRAETGWRRRWDVRTDLAGGGSPGLTDQGATGAGGRGWRRSGASDCRRCRCGRCR